MSESPTSFAWLIELCVPDGPVVVGGQRTPRGIYYSGQRGNLTADACEAVRFVRKEDAESVIPFVSPTNRPGAEPVPVMYEATEHGFYDMNVVAAPSKPQPCPPNCGHDHGPTLSMPEPEVERLLRCAANDIAYVFGTDVNVTSKVYSTVAIIKELLARRR